MSMRVIVVMLLVACEQKAPSEQIAVEANVAKADIIPIPEAKHEESHCPAWRDLRACKADGFVYATAKGSGTARLAETTAKNRARSALNGEKAGQVVIEQSEIPAVASCADGFHALARAPLAKIRDQKLAACDASLAAPAPEAGCPEWTTRRTYKEGDSVFVVSLIDEKLPLPLAKTQAENAARVDAQQYFRFSAKTVDGSTTTTTSGTLPAVKSQERVDCAGRSYVRLAFSAAL